MFCSRLLACLLLAANAAGCTHTTPTSSTLGTTLVQSAQVTGVRDVTVTGGQNSGIGTIAGSLLGGIIGSNIGGGNGSAIASVGGAIAGGIAGQKTETAAHTNTATELVVRFDNGDSRVFRIAPGEIYRVGDSVKVTTVNGISNISH